MALARASSAPETLRRLPTTSTAAWRYADAVTRAAAPRCSTHPRTLAGWRCDGCARELCPDCAVAQRAGTDWLAACGTCGGLARPLRLSRRRVPLASRLGERLAVPLRRGNLGLLAGLALGMAALQTVAGGGVVARLFVVGSSLVLFVEMAFFWAAFFATVRSGRRGEQDVERPDFSDLGALLGAGLAGGVALFPLLCAANVGARWTLPGSVGGGTPFFLLITGPVWTPLDTFYFEGLGGRLAAAGPLLWIAGAAYLVVLPVALLRAAELGPGGLSPVTAARIAFRLGPDGALASAAALLAGALALALDRALAPLLPRLPYVGAWLGATVVLYPWLVAAAVLGRLAHVRGAALGLGSDDEFSDPALPAAVPRGRPSSPRGSPAE